MKIPPDAILPREKITQYLLKPSPINDKSKYLARGGFDSTTAHLLEREIRRLTADVDAVLERVNEHGRYYNVFGEVIGPSTVRLPVRLVWLHRVNGEFAFVTLIPESRRRS